jgi:hypothetical protein
MAEPVSAADIDLSPVPGKVYFDSEREWWEELPYFLMVDRFQDSGPRTPVLSIDRSLGVQTPDDFYGGTLAGIRSNLDYIAGLGCTATWLSPVFENNLIAYHGYDINNYLSIDPHFGTKQDVIDLVVTVHRAVIRYSATSTCQPTRPRTADPSYACRQGDATNPAI